jgi:hypothetical protein
VFCIMQKEHPGPFSIPIFYWLSEIPQPLEIT